jgi:hypothetical protein
LHHHFAIGEDGRTKEQRIVATRKGSHLLPGAVDIAPSIVWGEGVPVVVVAAATAAIWLRMYQDAAVGK